MRTRRLSRLSTEPSPRARLHEEVRSAMTPLFALANECPAGVFFRVKIPAGMMKDGSLSIDAFFRCMENALCVALGPEREAEADAAAEASEAGQGGQQVPEDFDPEDEQPERD